MFILLVIYIICLFLIWWSYSGYIFYLFIYYLLRRGGQPKKIKNKKYPFISVTVCIFEEEGLIVEKINNLKKLNYPGKTEFILVDGGSKDKTLAKINKAIGGWSKFKLLKSKKGKINQLNKALARARGKIIVNTDVDALLTTDALKIIAQDFQQNDKIGAIGGYVIPKGNALEREYWQEQNQVRAIESLVYSSSIVTAPCYAFRKSLITSFPVDCIADDVYISFYIQSRNYLVKYDPKIVVWEVRSPKNYLEFFTHKFRKANAYIVETLRFVYAVNRFNIRLKVIFLTHFFQLVILPWVLLLFLAISVNLFIINVSYRMVVLFIFIFLLFNVFMASLLFNQKIFSLKLPGRKIKPINFKIFLYSNFILFFAIFTYFFFHQDDSYEKIK